MHVDDLADAIYFCLKKKISNLYLNVGSNDYISIGQLSKIIKKITNFKGEIVFDKTYPNGTKKRKLNTSVLAKHGWRAKISLEKGLSDYYNYFLNLRQASR